ncbi:MAG: hypothetical protein NTV87_07515, partial [Ignavibacteriae bacterium]|nr:hypothetical protein [Ignavibacteriota bacterium]
FITNPLKSNYDSFLKSRYGILSILDRLFKNAIYQDGLVDKLYKLVKDNSSITYYICLNIDDITNRGKLYRFLTQYNNSDLGTHFPIFYNFVPKSLIEKIHQLSDKIEEVFPE